MDTKNISVSTWHLPIFLDLSELIHKKCRRNFHQRLTHDATGSVSASAWSGRTLTCHQHHSWKHMEPEHWTILNYIELYWTMLNYIELYWTSLLLNHEFLEGTWHFKISSPSMRIRHSWNQRNMGISSSKTLIKGYKRAMQAISFRDHPSCI